jgi:DNA-binding transcriptional ArsR family regulator
MTMYSNIASTATLIGDSTRMAILTALTDGKALTAGELAYVAKVTPQTASAHLGKLVEGALITVEVQGRHRYYKLTGPEVVDAIEAIAVISPPVEVRSLRQSSQKKALEYARTCYNHLAGKFGVALTEALLEMDYLRLGGKCYLATEKGKKWSDSFGIYIDPNKLNLEAIQHHLDWTERKHHLAGPLALAIMNRLHELNWIKNGSIPRSIQITDFGRRKIVDEFGFDPTIL